MTIKPNKKAFEPTEKTTKHYVKTDGLYCLKCGSDNIEGDLFEADTGIAWQDITCLCCSSTWRDEYDLSGVSNFTDNS